MPRIPSQSPHLGPPSSFPIKEDRLRSQGMAWVTRPLQFWMGFLQVVRSNGNGSLSLQSQYNVREDCSFYLIWTPSFLTNHSKLSMVVFIFFSVDSSYHVGASRVFRVIPAHPTEVILICSMQYNRPLSLGPPGYPALTSLCMHWSVWTGTFGVSFLR